MDHEYDFSGWATRNDLVCADGRTIRRDAFKHCDGKIVPLVWNHQHNDPANILGHALLENRTDGVYAYGTFNETESGKAAKALVMHGDVESLSIYANGLKQTSNRDVMHGDIRELSLVIAGANPGAFIDFVDLAHGEGAEQEVIIGTGEGIILYHSDAKPATLQKTNSEEKPTDLQKTNFEEEKDMDEKKRKTEDEETVQDVVDSMTEKQKTVMYALIGAAMEDANSDDTDDDSDEENNQTKGGNRAMKHNIFDQEETRDTVLSHSDQQNILALARQNSVGTLRTALGIYAEQNEELMHGIDNIDALFPDFKDLRPGAPETVTRDQGWVSVVMKKIHKSPISRIRTRQMDVRGDTLRAHGYQKTKQKQSSGNMALISRTTMPQTVYRTDALNRDDIVDITDFDVVEYQYGVMRENLNEEVATAIMVGDGRTPDDVKKISEESIRSIWNDNETYTIHRDVDIEAAREELQGTNTGGNFGDNYVIAEAFVTAALYARESYKGTGTPDLFCAPHMLNVMLLARDLNGRRIYSSKQELAAVMNVGDIHTVEQFEGLIRTDASNNKHKLLGLFVNLADYTVGSTKGGEITKFEQFDIDFNQNKYLIETRLSGALTKIASAIALEEPVNP